MSDPLSSDGADDHRLNEQINETTVNSFKILENQHTGDCAQMELMILGGISSLVVGSLFWLLSILASPDTGYVWFVAINFLFVFLSLGVFLLACLFQREKHIHNLAVTYLLQEQHEKPNNDLYLEIIQKSVNNINEKIEKHNNWNNNFTVIIINFFINKVV